RTCPAQLLFEHAGFGGREPPATVFLRPGRRGPAFRSHAVQPELGVWVGPFRAAAAPERAIALIGDRARGAAFERGRQTRLDPASGFAAETFEIAHGTSPDILSAAILASSPRAAQVQRD